MRSSATKLVLLGLVLTMVLAVSACRGGDEAVYIGLANPISGDNAWVGETKNRAVELAVKMANAEGGIDGKEIKVLIEDDAGQANQAVQVAKKLAGDSRVVAIIGHWYSTCALAALPTYDQNEIPLISDAASEDLTDSSPNMFRICLTAKQTSEQIARYMYEVKGLRNVVSIYPMVDFGIGANEGFVAEFEELGGTVLAEEGFVPGTRDFSSQITKVSALDPEAIFFGGYYTECAMLAKQSDRADLDLPMFGTDAVSAEDLVTLGEESVEGVTFVGYFDPAHEYTGTAEFVSAFQAEYGMEPDSWAALAFDSANLILEGIRQEGPSREGVRNFLSTVSEFPGVAGPVTFLDSGNCERLLTILTVKDGEITPAEEQWAD